MKTENYKNEQLENELEWLMEMERKVRISLKSAPSGKLRCEMARGKYPQYYYICKEKNITFPGEYIKRADEEFARQLAQKEYDEQLLKLIEKRKKFIMKFLDDMRKTHSIEEIVSSLNIGKQRLINSHIKTDEEYINQWYDLHPTQQNAFPITNGFITEKGDIVRSKSEKIIADKLFFSKIPYVYEAPLKFTNYRVVYPDFTILNINSRKTFYLEHLGMMDTPEYCKNAIEKIEEYEQNNIFINEELLITLESSKKPLSVLQVDRLIERFLIL